MPAKTYYDKDADLALLKNKTIAILGYGSQGHAHAQNLRDSGCTVIVAELPGTPNGDLAVKDGFTPITATEATKQADVLTLLLPDELQGEIFRTQIRDNLAPGKVIVCSHGFNVHYGQFDVPKGVSIILVAPKGPGHLLRADFVRGAGVPCLIAVGEGSGKEAFNIGMAYAKGIGGTRAGVIETTFAEETETDLFGEQAVLCGGVSALMKAGFETLVEAGYQPESAYFECLHELKLIVDLMYEQGIAGMRFSVSDTAEYGDLTRGPRIIDDRVRAEMRRILAEIKDGSFAAEWVAEDRAGRPRFNALRAAGRDHQIESVGAELRAMMPFVTAGRQRLEDVSGG